MNASQLSVRLAARLQRRRWRQFLAWCVHLYTALGLVAAAGIGVLIVRGDPPAFRLAFVLMLVATLIDATDGTLARMVRIKETLPGFDGRRLDDIVDFLNYTFLPLFLLWRADIPEGHTWSLLVPLLASAYGFCQVSAKTDDGYFLGFPSYWNLVAFYLYVLRPPLWLSLALLLGLALLTFVPFRYLYGTQPGRLNRLTNLFGGVWAALIVWVLAILPPSPSLEDLAFRLTLVSLFFPAYYLGASWLVSLRLWNSRRSRPRSRAGR